ncbi:hypothetical protein [Rhizobium sp.]|uniref:hypothetical protein n=1 Tax=Rhizobium sp. TaxID=391 RepID=UPI0028AFD570
MLRDTGGIALIASKAAHAAMSVMFSADRRDAVWTSHRPSCVDRKMLARRCGSRKPESSGGANYFGGLSSADG